MTTRLEYAQRYSAAGFCVVPLKSKGKKPEDGFNLKKYFSIKPTDSELQQWFGNGHERNIALILGKISEAFALDIDGEEASNYLDSKASSMSASLRRAWENTMVTKTGSGT